MYGAEDQDRTGDPTIFSRVLYQLSYLGSDAYSNLCGIDCQETGKLEELIQRCGRNFKNVAAFGVFRTFHLSDREEFSPCDPAEVFLE